MLCIFIQTVPNILLLKVMARMINCVDIFSILLQVQPRMVLQDKGIHNQVDWENTELDRHETHFYSGGLLRIFNMLRCIKTLQERSYTMQGFQAYLPVIFFSHLWKVAFLGTDFGNRCCGGGYTRWGLSQALVPFTGRSSAFPTSPSRGSIYPLQTFQRAVLLYHGKSFLFLLLHSIQALFLKEKTSQHQPGNLPPAQANRAYFRIQAFAKIVQS